MQMGADDFEAAIATLKSGSPRRRSPAPSAYFTLAIAYYQIKDIEAALVPAKKAIELAENPQQGWLQLLLAIYLTKEDYASATPVLVELLSRYPEVGKAYWLQLATLYGVQKDIPRALAVMQLAHRRKLLDEDANVRRLALLLQSEDIPIRSVRVLEQGFEQKVLKEEATSYEMLGNSWILARESDKAEPALEKAAELSPEGDLYVRLGQVRLLKEDCDGATAALKSGLAKGGIDDPGQAEQLLGITYYNAGKLGEARTWFAKSRRSEKARPTSDAWLKHIDEEIQKQSERAVNPARSVCEISQSEGNSDDEDDAQIHHGTLRCGPGVAGLAGPGRGEEGGAARDDRPGADRRGQGCGRVPEAHQRDRRPGARRCSRNTTCSWRKPRA